MNRAFQVVIGLSIILLVVMLIIFFKGPDSSETQAAAMAAIPQPAAKPAAASEPKAKPKVHTERRRDAREGDAEPQNPATPVLTVTVEIPPPPFPGAGDVTPGMTREQMIGRFGTPRVAASWAENGSLAEKFIYTRDAQVTAVMLLDGEVVRSRTGHVDPSVRPRWADPANKAVSP
jgi:hypothetical protein